MARWKGDVFFFLLIITVATIARDANALSIVKERALIDVFSRGSTKMSIRVAEW